MLQLWGDRNLVSAAAVSEVKSQHGKDVVVENLFGEGEKEDSGKNGNRFLISAAAVSEMKGGGRRELLTEEEGVRHLVSAAAVSDVKSQKGKEVILDDTEQQQVGLEGHCLLRFLRRMGSPSFVCVLEERAYLLVVVVLVH